MENLKHLAIGIFSEGNETQQTGFYDAARSSGVVDDATSLSTWGRAELRQVKSFGDLGSFVRRAVQQALSAEKISLVIDEDFASRLAASASATPEDSMLSDFSVPLNTIILNRRSSVAELVDAFMGN